MMMAAAHLVPPAFDRVLTLLREAPREAWPATSAAHARVIDGYGVESAAGQAMTLARRDDERGRRAKNGRRLRPPVGNRRFPELASALFELEVAMRDGGAPSASCLVTSQAVHLPHRSLGRGAIGSRESLLVTLGAHTGGELVIEGNDHRVLYAPKLYDAWSCTSWTNPFEGERFSLQFYTSARESLADLAEQIVNAQRPRFRYRTGSTDVNVVCEVLGDRPAYAGMPRSDFRWPDVDFSPRGHVVIDGGAHIGAFAAWALNEGATHVQAYEPEPSNAELLSTNLEAAVEAGRADVTRAAIAAGSPGVTELVIARPRSDGALNTWRHALAGCSHYQDGGGKGDGAQGGGEEGAPAALVRLPVETIPLFGEGGALSDETTFVKLDVEGAELALLRGYAPGAWRGVTRLVFEYSFTKEPDMRAFDEVVRLLEREGFTVMYEGRGSWERLDRWPWHMDALVFAAR